MLQLRVQPDPHICGSAMINWKIFEKHCIYTEHVEQFVLAFTALMT